MSKTVWSIGADCSPEAPIHNSLGLLLQCRSSIGFVVIRTGVGSETVESPKPYTNVRRAPEQLWKPSLQEDWDRLGQLAEGSREAQDSFFFQEYLSYGLRERGEYCNKARSFSFWGWYERCRFPGGGSFSRRCGVEAVRFGLELRRGVAWGLELNVSLRIERKA